ncbi:tRNA lysidine(34) synthetase TilS [Nitrococcus mobilis]|uniref:tRNA(Ile)-lysidine synthase n=1 Tax=Nitrococcus mobilis Nb-231 TaxID=314278 RepID=A4BS39_9GAMM|nr:tRNA lysidine(34) synthetase TilS [Nitrococcus mobilis]EAR21518.1 tRNA(Ile)-lysidine synthase [Nitrococcus mobilis Nb-231]
MGGFSVAAFALAMRPWRPIPRLWIAYSGGCDSTVLLHAAVTSGLPVSALHVDHGLHPESGDWALHCRARCQALGVPLRVEPVTVRDGGEGLEAAARKARYQAYAAILAPGECIATAHHVDDQAETVLLRILRGTGIDGLAGIPAERELGEGRLIRPLLGFCRAELVAYATRHELSWIDDPANRCDRHDRSFLREHVVPLLETRWPGLAQRLTRLARHADAASMLTERWARRQLTVLGDDPCVLPVAVLAEFDEAERVQLLRSWIRRQGRRPPPERRLCRGLMDLLRAAPDRQPALVWADGCIRRYRGRLYLLPPRLPQPPAIGLPWDMRQPLNMPELGRLEARPSVGRGLRAQCVRQAPVEVRFRQGGEHMRLRGHARSHALKRLLQERGVPPWVRERLPLIFIGHELAAVADLLLAESFSAGPAEPGLELCWRFSAARDRAAPAL